MARMKSYLKLPLSSCPNCRFCFVPFSKSQFYEPSIGVQKTLTNVITEVLRHLLIGNIQLKNLAWLHNGFFRISGLILESLGTLEGSQRVLPVFIKEAAMMLHCVLCSKQKEHPRLRDYSLEGLALQKEASACLLYLSNPS
uniref:Uncharacterized protein n=1 Tax=Amphimedon queenslandica TaxID=400682 RepID=A0A1X7TDX8_AMPQE